MKPIITLCCCLLAYMAQTQIPLDSLETQASLDSLGIQGDSIPTITGFPDLNIGIDTVMRYEEWGNVPQADRELAAYELDSSAQALILQDVGFTRLAPYKKATVVWHTHWRRIKVFDPQAFDQGNLSLPIRLGMERLENLEVQVIQPNGEVQTVKTDNLFLEKVSKQYNVHKVFVPNLQRGSVVEYRYTVISSDLFSLYDWYFQHDMPVRWSELTTIVPRRLEYTFQIHAPHELALQENVIVDIATAYMRFAIKDLPALRTEPMITTLDDYRARVQFQLKSVPSQMFWQVPVMSTWKQLANWLAEVKGFGKQYTKTSNYKSLWKAFKVNLSDKETPESLMEKALRFVSSNIRWNEVHYSYVYKDLEAVLSRQSGNSAEVNLALVALLREAGLDVWPLLLSTRSNGLVSTEYPFLQQFNSVVALVRHGDQTILLDATDPLHGLNELRDECYNGKGWIPNPAKPEWFDIAPPETSVTWYGNMAMDEQGNASGSFVLSGAGALATAWRKALAGPERADFLKENFASEFKDVRFETTEIEGEHALGKALKFKFNCQIGNAAQSSGDFLYLKPVFDFFPTENLFKSPIRQLPVNFALPFKSHYVLNIKLPEGYVLEEKPESVRMALPNNGGRLQFSCDLSKPGELQLLLKMNLAQTVFEVEAYPSLRAFFDAVAEKANIQLALKKQ